MEKGNTKERIVLLFIFVLNYPPHLPIEFQHSSIGNTFDVTEKRIWLDGFN